MHTHQIDETQQELMAWLQSPQAWPHPPLVVEHVETHISHVFLAGELVYKLKKAVRFPFLDFSTLERREHACREELRLNRRLAPQVYQDVLPIVRSSAGELAIGGARTGASAGGDGDVVDWLVQMRRLPQERMLDVLHHRGELRPYHLDQLAALLSRFYTGAVRVTLTPEQYRNRCLAHVRENRQSLLATLPAEQSTLVDRTHAFQLQLLHLQPTLFDARAQGGRIVEGHGDLRAEHVCLTDPIAIFDCIEFREEFRQLDVADELAFLAADCDFLGAEWVGPQLIHRYSQLSGDHPPAVLLDFYKAYRACVRAKVAALRGSQLHGPEREAALHEAAAHLAFADRYAAPYQRPLVVVIGGLSGSGKTTLAGRVADELSARRISSDVVRRESLGPSSEDQDVGAGNYSPEQRSRIYEEMLCRARQWHREGLSVVLDATFVDHEALRAAHDLSRDHHSTFLAIECRCAPTIALERIASRRAEGRDASEAHADVYAQQAQSWSPWPTSIPQLAVDTEQSIDNQVERVLGALRTLHPSDGGSV